MNNGHDGQEFSTADPDHIAVSKSKGIKIDWKDGHHSEYGLTYLRRECPCATCTGAHGTQPQRYESPAVNPLQLYKPVLKIEHVEPVGGYAIRILWNDGHQTGIYSFDHLRAICPCTSCRPMGKPS
jgi:DUF971 family protein